jgi:vacuolar-type H+-ATPase subunit E/Vma4
MALPELLAALAADARARATAEIERGRAQAAAIREQAAAQASATSTTALAARERAARATLALELQAARAAARRDVLVARERLLERVFAEARRRLAGAEGDAAVADRLPERLRAAMELAGDGPLTVRCTAGLAGRLRELLPETSSIRLEIDPTLGAGFQVLAAADGGVLIDDTAAARLERRRPRLAIAVTRAVEVERGAPE